MSVNVVTGSGCGFLLWPTLHQLLVLARCVLSYKLIIAKRIYNIQRQALQKLRNRMRSIQCGVSDKSK